MVFLTLAQWSLLTACTVDCTGGDTAEARDFTKSFDLSAEDWQADLDTATDSEAACEAACRYYIEYIGDWDLKVETCHADTVDSDTGSTEHIECTGSGWFPIGCE